MSALHRAAPVAAGVLMPVVFVGHGGGPSFLFDKSEQPRFAGMDKSSATADFLRGIASTMPRPTSILVVSAHWEAADFTVMAAPAPPMLFDYYGFPPRSYEVKYPAPGNPALAARVSSLLSSAGIPSATDSARGYDHGVFIPLLLMYPDADIPVIQVSLRSSLLPEEHLRLGAALAPLRAEGSGAITHSFAEMSSPGGPARWATEFEDWVTATVTETVLARRTAALTDFESAAPSARRAHPRTEHFIPLLVAAGAAVTPDGAVSVGKKVNTAWVGNFSLSAYKFE